MKKYLLLIGFYISFLLSINFCYAQGVAVNTDGSAADPSALLDVKSSSQGVLVPRMTFAARNLISSPANGLLIYQTDNTPGFYYNAGTPGSPSWTTLKGASGAGVVNGSSAGQIYLTGSSPFAPQSPQSVTGDITINSSAVTSYNNIVPTNKGGAGNINGILSADGSGTVSAASTTGTGSVVLASGVTGSGSAVLATSPTLVTPSLGTPTALVGTNISGTAASLTAGHVITNANLTGDVTSVGNTTSYNNIVPVAKGGTGVPSATLTAGTNVTISGTWPNQTINATAGGGSFPSITTAPTALTPITTSGTYQTMKSITFPSTGYYLVSAFVNITSQQTSDEYHLKITQGAAILAGNTDYYAADGLLSASIVVNVVSVATPVLIQCSNGGTSTGAASGSYSVVKLSN